MQNPQRLSEKPEYLSFKASVYSWKHLCVYTVYTWAKCNRCEMNGKSMCVDSACTSNLPSIRSNPLSVPWSVVAALTRASTGSVHTVERSTSDTATQPVSVHMLAYARSLVCDKHLSQWPPVHSLGSRKKGNNYTRNTLKVGCLGCRRLHPALTLRGSEGETQTTTTKQMNQCPLRLLSVNMNR